MGSILGETKEALGLAADAEGFDNELIQHINSVLSDLNQLGVGPGAGYAITDEDATWETFLGSDPRLNSARSYMFYKVKMLFDPPQVGYVLTSYEKLIEEAAWRLTVKANEPRSNRTSGRTTLVGDLGDEHVITLTDPPGGGILIDSTGVFEAEFIPTGSGQSRSVELDLSELAAGVLKLTVVIADGVYVVRRLNPRRTILRMEVTSA